MELDQKLAATDIASLLRRDIAGGAFQAHDRLPPERVLSETYRAARGTVRKALMQLEDEGFVDIRAGSGTYVREQASAVSPASIANASPLELIDARFALEPHVCRLAVLNARPADFERMDDLCTAMEAYVDDPVRFSEADTDFHRALVESTRNGLLIWIIDQIGNVRGQDDWTRMRQLTLNTQTIETYNTQHRRILDAIRAREPERAAETMKAHLETARLSLMRASAT